MLSRAFRLLALLPCVYGVRKAASRGNISAAEIERHGEQVDCPDVSGSGQVSWRAFGGVNKGKNVNKRVDSKASAGDFEFVIVGGSNGGSSANEDKPWDAGLMEGQGFKLIVVRGDDDRKAEVWWRRSTGGGTVKITGKAKDNPYTILTAKGDLKPQCAKTASVRDASSSKAKLKFPGGTGFTIAVFFFDDTGKLERPSSPGKLACRNWGYGDGDGFGVVVYQPGDEPPSVFPYDKLASSGGSQYITVTAVIPVGGGDCSPSSPSPGDENRRRRRRRDDDQNRRRRRRRDQ